MGLLVVNPSAKYEHGRQQEAIAYWNWIMMHEHPFSIVKEEGFDFMMKCCNISYEERTVKKHSRMIVFLFMKLKDKS